MRKQVKRALVLGFGLLSIIVLFYATLVLNPSTIKFDAPRLLFNRYTIYPFRTILEHSGKVVVWDKKKRQISIEPAPDSFTLNIRTEAESGIPVYVDKEYIGKSPVYKRLPAGKYLVTTRPPGRVGSIRYLTLKAGDQRDQKIVLPLDRHNYQDFLDEILQQGYQPLRVMDYYNHAPINQKTVILRHDVDESAEYALKMAEIEYSKGIRSTYYFRWKTVDAGVIKTLRDMGFEVGLHYETLADYGEERHLKSAQEITPEVTAELRRRLKVEIADFRRQYGEIYTISSHGASKNNELGVSNFKAIMEGQNPQDYGIIGTAYGDITLHFTYLSDAGGIWDPFPYPQIDNQAGPLYFLIHPIHWTSSYH